MASFLLFFFGLQDPWYSRFGLFFVKIVLGRFGIADVCKIMKWSLYHSEILGVGKFLS
jgi:hypothetical protein